MGEFFHLDLSRVVFIVIRTVPVLAIWVTGAIVAGIRWQRHPRVSALVLCASALSLVAFAVNLIIIIPTILGRMLAFGELNVLISAGTSVMHALAMALILTAAFLGRPSSSLSNGAPLQGPQKPLA